MIQGVSFSDQGPVMQGTWYNPSTGDQFTVRDSFFENNQYVVTTTDGRTLNYNQIQNYIKSEKPIQVEPKKTSEELPASVAAILEEPGQTSETEGMLQEDAALLGNLYQENPVALTTQISTAPRIPSVNTDTYIIEKALSKVSKPTINFQVDWKDFPAKEIEMLKTMMDISVSDIVKWYISKIDQNEICTQVLDAMKGYITDKLSPKPEPEKIAEPSKSRKKSAATGK